jgi:hypothetical protein
MGKMAFTWETLKKKKKNFVILKSWQFFPKKNSQILLNFK